MSHRKKIFFDAALILTGVGFSTLFISTDGNGQNPLPVAAGMLFISLIVGAVSFVLARFIRSLPLSITASIFTCDLLFVFYFVCRFAFSKQVLEHGNEELILLPIVFVVVTAPTILLGSIGFVRIASRFYQRKNEPAGK